MQFKFIVMKLSAFLFFVSVLFVPAVSFSNECALLGDNLYNCTPFECDTKSPDNPKLVIHNRIVGLNSVGACVHEQANADGEKVLCRYSEESRKFLAIRIKKHSSTLSDMPQGSEFEESILGDIFANECDVSSPHGDDKPVVAEDENAESLDDDYNESDNEEPSAATTASEPVAESVEEKIEDNGDLLIEGE